MTYNIVEIRDLCKSYGNLQAVKNISFSIEEGKKIAFLGPNGAGKSTTISILCTLIKPDSGSITIDRMDISDQDIRKKIGVIFQDSLLDKDLTVRENLVFAADLYGIPKNEISSKLKWISETMNLSDIIDRRYGILSGGQRRRTDIARALINDPRILFLDEPSTGLDPQNRKMIWEYHKRSQ
jgi:multidrug/hemolysin transport system ATP-binding protein